VRSVSTQSSSRFLFTALKDLLTEPDLITAIPARSEPP
jgi:hypothetical protein